MNSSFLTSSVCESLAMGDDPDAAPEGCLHLTAAGQKSVGKMLRQIITGGGGSKRLQIQVLSQSARFGLCLM